MSSTEADDALARLESDGAAGPPRANGEVVFTAPWQSRLFATTLSLHQQGRFEWDQFRTRLIAAIAAHEAQLATSGDGYDYWGCWLAAVEDLLTDLHLVDGPELDDLSDRLAARPPDH